MAREKPLHEQMKTFCRYHLGKDCFAPFTGTDYAAWAAFCYLLQCYTFGGGDRALDGLKATVRSAQPREAVLLVFVQTIPGVMDWGDVARLWPKIVEGLRGVDALYLHAIEREEFYRGDSKHVEERRRAHGVRRPTPDAAQAGAQL